MSTTPFIRTIRKLLGFRSKRRWKMLVAGLYYAFCALMLIGVFSSIKPYAKSSLDIALDVMTSLLLWLLLVSPALLLSDLGYRDKLPLFKGRRPVQSALGLTVVFLLLAGAAAYADSLHTQPYKLAAEAEKAAAQKKQAAEDKAKADAAARAAAAEASRAAAAQAQAKANEAAAKAAAVRQAAATADAQKKKQQQAYLDFESAVFATEKPATAAIADFQKQANAASKGDASALEFFGAITDAKNACKDVQLAYGSLDTPSGLPDDVRDLCDKAKQDVGTAYMVKAEAFDAMASYMDDQKLSELQDYKDKMAQAESFTVDGAVQLAQAREKLGLQPKTR